MRPIVLLCFSILFQNALSDSTFRFGAVLTSIDGPLSEAREMIEARYGYELYIDAVNAENDGRGFFLPSKPNSTNGFHFNYEFLWKEDFGEPKIHEKELIELIEKDRVHFIGGSHPDFAHEEMRIANANGLINFHCCVEPDSFYENDLSTVFGIPASNNEYAKNFISALFLTDIGRVAIISDESDHFTKTSCDAAVEYFNSTRNPLGMTDLVLHERFLSSIDGPEKILELADAIVDQKIDAVLGCLSLGDGRRLVDAIHQQRYSLKAMFLSKGPQHQDWIDAFDPPTHSNALVTGIQFHHKLKYPDAFFGSSREYSARFYTRFGQTPDCTGAGASAVGLTLTEAIKNAFAMCDISETKGDVDRLLYEVDAIQCKDKKRLRGYDRVLKALSLVDLKTFFGDVRFNLYRRNVGKTPVTTQVFERISDDGIIFREVEPIMPVSFASELPKFPAENQYKETCRPGFFVGPDSFNPCLRCPKGEMSFKNNALHCESCPIGEYAENEGQSHCSVCPEGTVTHTRGATSRMECQCRPGFYNLEKTSGIECHPCPVGAECAGGTSFPVAMNGYWTNASSPTEVYECDPSNNCKGGKTMECATGYEGRLCAECSPGYFSVMDSCVECLCSSILALSYISLLCGWYFINVTVSRSVTSLEMILGWAQLANIIGDVNLNWTAMVRQMFNVANILDFDVDILEPSCWVQWGYRENFVTQLLLPFIISAMAATAYLGSAAAFVMIQRQWIRPEGKRNGFLSIFVDVPKDKDALQQKWDVTIARFLASVDVTYVTIAKYCMDVFKCETIADVSVLREDPNVLCNTEEHKILIVLASFGLIFYVLGYPVYVVWKLLDLGKERSFSNATHLRRYGFIYDKFELDYYYTPALIIIRKLLFVSILVYVNNPAFQVGALAVIITVSLMIHVYTAPYMDTYLDVLFSFLLVALMFEAFGGLIFYSDNLPQTNRQILEWLVIGTLFLLLIVFLAIFILEISQKYQRKYIKKQHLAYSKNGDFKGNKLFGFQRTLNSPLSTVRENSDVSFELLNTFKPSFVYNCLRERPDFIKNWDNLTDMLKDYMSDQSDTSYLSMNPIAKFWRKLVDHFPELVDFLAVADDATLEKFNDVATNLYRNFYLTKKISPLPLMEILNWRDYAPMAQWLAIASYNDRNFFLTQVATMFRMNGRKEEAEVLEMKLLYGGLDPHIEERGSGNKTDRRQRYLNSIHEGSHPFMHSASLKIDDVPVGDVERMKRPKHNKGFLSKNVEKEKSKEIETETSETAPRLSPTDSKKMANQHSFNSDTSKTDNKPSSSQTSKSGGMD